LDLVVFYIIYDPFINFVTAWIIFDDPYNPQKKKITKLCIMYFSQSIANLPYPYPYILNTEHKFPIWFFLFPEKVRWIYDGCACACACAPHDE